jgi:hypothetical protein
MPTERFERRLSGLLLISFLVVLAMLARPIFVGGVYTHDDLGWLQLPLRYLYSQALKAGDSVLWAPQLSNGMYLLGEGHVGAYHPLHWLLYRFLSFELAFNLEFILSYAWMFPGTYLMLRRLELPQYASLFGAMAFTFSGFNLLHFMHPDQLAINSHIPWLILAIDTALRTTDPRKLAAAQLSISLLTGSQLLLGHPQQVWFSALAEGLFVVWRLKDSVSWWRIMALAVAKLTGGLMGAVQVIPTMDALAHSIRMNPSLDFVLRFSLHPINLIQLWSPFTIEGRTFDTFKQEAVLYNGVFCTLALVWLFVRRHSLGQWRSLVVATSSFAAVMLIVALGKYGGIYQWMSVVPLIGLFRGPSRYITLVHLAMAVLGAIALADLVGLACRRERVAWRALWPFAALASLSLATTVAAAWFLSQAAHHDWAAHLAPVKYSLFGLTVIMVATALVVAAARGLRWSAYVIIIWMVIDITTWGVLWVWEVPPRSVEAIAGGHIEPPQDGAGRVYSPWNSANSLAINGYELSHGYYTFVPARKIDPRELTAQRLAGVRWALNTNGLKTIKRKSPFEFPQGHGSWITVPEPMPRVRMLTDARVSDSVTHDIEQIDIAKTALLDQTVEIEPGEPGTASIVTERSGLIEVLTSAPSRQLLVLSESYHPGWKATKDGQSIPVMRAYGDFQSAVVGPGEQRLIFQFRPTSFVAGAWISGIGLFSALAVFLVVLRFARRTSVKLTPGRCGVQEAA